MDCCGHCIRLCECRSSKTSEDDCDGEDDRIYSIYLLDDTVSTKEGIKITDDVSKMKEVYGSGYTEQGESYLYSKNATTLQFYTSNGVIIGIEYSTVIDN